MKEIALPIVMSSIISSGDFFTLLLVRSEAVRDLGLFAGFSILAAGLLTLVFLPHLTKKITWEQNRENIVNRSVRKLASYPVEKHRLVTGHDPVVDGSFLLYFPKGLLRGRPYRHELYARRTAGCRKYP